MTLLKEIADKFIENILRDHPIMMYELDYELREYLPSIKEHKYSRIIKQIVNEHSTATGAARGITIKEVREYEGDEKLLNTMQEEYLQNIALGGRPLLYVEP